MSDTKRPEHLQGMHFCITQTCAAGHVHEIGLGGGLDTPERAYAYFEQIERRCLTVGCEAAVEHRGEDLRPGA